MKRHLLAFWKFLGDDRLALLILGALAGVATKNLVDGLWLYFIFSMALFSFLVRSHWKALAKPSDSEVSK